MIGKRLFRWAIRCDLAGQRNQHLLYFDNFPMNRNIIVARDVSEVPGEEKVIFQLIRRATGNLQETMQF